MDSKVVHIIASTKKALVIGNLQFSSVTDFRLTDEDLKKAYQELNEREDVKLNCLRSLKERLERDGDILYRTDDNYLLRYLRYTRFDADKAYDMIIKLYSLRMKHPEIFSLPSNLETLLNYRYFTFLPFRDQEGRPVGILDFRKWNINELSLSEFLTVVSTSYDIIMMNPHAQITGCVGIWDLRGLSVKKLTQILHSPMRMLGASILQECYPLRTSIIIIIHCSPIIRMAFHAFEWLFERKILQRMKLLGSDMTELHQYVHPAILPKEYGGNLEENECSITDLIMYNMPYLKYERSFGQTSICKLHPIIERANMH